MVCLVFGFGLIWMFGFRVCFLLWYLGGVGRLFIYCALGGLVVFTCLELWVVAG